VGTTGQSPETIVAELADFGYYLGMLTQINNDLRVIDSLRDIIHRKPSFPLIVASRQIEGN
jgi:hypothetical protein